MSRPIGKRIFEVCEIVEKHGNLTYREVFVRHGEICVHNSRKYCQRAVEYGLMIVDKTAKPARFSVADGWRKNFYKQKNKTNQIELPSVIISSVFDLAKGV